MTNYQSPTTYCYSEEKKLELLNLSKQYGFYIIEDDFLTDLTFDKEVRTPLKGLDNNDKVIFIKSFSKISMPGLRLAFLVIPKTLYNDVLSAKHISDISTSGIIQRAFEIYLTGEGWSKNLKHISDRYHFIRIFAKII